jgi:hypothetical protein
VKLLVDMNLSPQWVDRLNVAGLPAVHWSGIGRMDALIAALKQMAPELATGARLTVDPGRTRLHLLPLHSNK